MPLGGAVIAGAGLLYGAYKGIKDDAKASAIQKGLTNPTYAIPPAFLQNRELARSMAQQGIPQQQYNNQINNINQTQAGAIAAEQNSANPGSAITSTVRAGNQAKATLDAEDAQARENNQRYFIQQNAAYGNQELAKQQNDVYDKFTRDFNQMQAYRGAANQNYNNAISGAQNLGLTALNNQQPDTTTPTTPATPQGNWGYPSQTTSGTGVDVGGNPATGWGGVAPQQAPVQPPFQYVPNTNRYFYPNI